MSSNNMYSKRDWSDSRDFVKGVWLMLNQKEPRDYLLASGEAHSIREFVEKAFDAAGFHGHWEGKGVDEKYLDSGGRHKYLFVKVNPDFYRPAEVELLLGDPKEAIEELGWKPKNSFDSLVLKMVQWDIEIQQSKCSTEKSSSSWVG